MTKKLKILFIPIDAIGHVNAAIGVAQVLYDAGHHIIFAINDQWKGRLSKYGFDEILLQQQNRQGDDDPAKYWSELFIDAIKNTDPLDTIVNLFKTLYPAIMDQMKQLDPIIERLLPEVNPDVIIIDQALEMPSVTNSGIPWVHTCSFNPLFSFYDERVPPPNFGLPSIGMNGHKDEWKRCRQAVNNAIAGHWLEYNDFVMSKGLPQLPDHQFYFGSPYLNIYGYPLELDYLDMRPMPDKWVRFDNLKRTDKHLQTFEIPEKLKNKQGKLIYFSMGSMGGADVDNMNRLLGILGRTRHRYIVSMGPSADRIKLFDNMWGAGSVPQIQVLPLVDLVITHGGNNTFTETLYFGKPMIVLPLFGDQYDNAQRVQDKGFGIKLDTYRCDEFQIFNAIEGLLNDKEMNGKLREISKRIQSDNSIAKLPKLIENIVNCNVKIDCNNN